MTNQQVIDEVTARITRMMAVQSHMASGAVEERAQLRGTPINLNVGSLRPTPALVVATLATLLSSGGDVTVAALSAVAVKVVESWRWLSRDELDVVEFILKERRDEAYKSGIDESALRRSYEDATFNLDSVLASLGQSGVVVRASGRIRLTF